MASKGRLIRRAAIGTYLMAIHALLGWLLIDKYVTFIKLDVDLGPVAVESPPEISVADPTPVVTPTPLETPYAARKVIIPVAGVNADQLVDNYAELRTEDRQHGALDIAAPAGTPVLAAVDGEIVKFHDSEMGGITIYQISVDRKYFFYYAHLQRRAEGIGEKQFVRQGTIIGYVGDTGNAGTGNYHLHFAITSVIDPERFWAGTSINPYPILKGEAELQ